MEIDFEIGASLSGCSAWDFSIANLEDLVFSSLLQQKFELEHDIDVADTMRTVFVEGWEHAPKWMKKQAKNLGWKFKRSKWAALTEEHAAKLEKPEAEDSSED